MCLAKSIAQGYRFVNPEDWDGDYRSYGRMAMKEVLEFTMNNRIDRYLDELSRQELVPSDRRNGSYRRKLLTQLGCLEIKVPRTRRVSGLQLIGGLARRQKEIDELILCCFCLGMSTRKVSRTLLQCLGIQVSASLVSEVCKVLDSEVMRYHNRNFSDNYQVLIFDGVVMKERTAIGSRERVVLVAMGLKPGGEKEIIDYYLGEKGESQNSWEKFLGILYHRGLQGKNLQLVVSDGNPGLLSAIDLFFPSTPAQRCWAHKVRNILESVPRSEWKKLGADLRKIHCAQSRKEADAETKKFLRKWASLYPKAAKSLIEDYENLCHFMDLNAQHWTQTKTTNLLERAFEEVRRRTKIMGVFKNRQSLERILFSVFYFYNQNQVPIFALTQNA
jgi:transposase-like protein